MDEAGFLLWDKADNGQFERKVQETDSSRAGAPICATGLQIKEQSSGLGALRDPKALAMPELCANYYRADVLRTKVTEILVSFSASNMT